MELGLLGPEQVARPVPPLQKSVGEVRPPRIAKYMVTAKSELAESSDEVGPSWSKANGIAAASAAFKSAGEPRPSRIVKCSVTSESESELARSSDEETSDEAVPGCARPSRRGKVEALTLVPRERAQHWTVEQVVNCPRFALL